MSSASLIPDRQMTFSPGLAQTIGLEEAILLQGIGHRLTTETRWCELPLDDLAREFPFWGPDQIRAILQRLADLGILSLLSGNTPGVLLAATAGSLTTEANRGISMEPQTTPWTPPPALLELLELSHGIDPDFARAQLKEFDCGDATRRESRFRHHVLAAWRRSQSKHPAFSVHVPPRFDNDWQPSPDATDILQQADIDLAFADSVRPEFILYWRERGGPPKDVNSRFVGFVRQRWARHQSGLAHSREPQRLTSDWRPDPSVWEMIDMAGITRSFVEERLPEFVLYWVDSNELHTSWNTKFLQHIKYQWRREQTTGAQHDGQQIGATSSPGGRTRDRSLTDDLSDSSWAN